jgi:hypothetical protein
VTADTGFASDANMAYLHKAKINAYIPDNQASKSPYADWMKYRVDSDYGKLVCSHRMSTVEPVFGNLEHNKEKVNGQWQLYCLVHNIEKLKNYGQQAA